MSEFMLTCQKCHHSVAVKKTDKGTSYICPKCGVNVDTSGYKILTLGSVPIAFSESIQKYADYYRVMQSTADTYASEAETLFRQIKSIEDFVAFFPNGCLHFFVDCVNNSVKTLTSLGIYEYDYSTLVDYIRSRPYGTESFAEKFRNQMVDFIDELSDKKDAHEEYLKYKDQTRGRWSGGGFGLKGALKGAAMAGALNMVGDIGSSISQSWQRSEFDDKIKREILKKCHSEDTIYDFKEAVRIDTIIILSAIYDICVSHHIYSSKKYHLYEMDKADKAIVNNIKNGLLPEKDAVSAILNIILKNPFCQSATMLSLLYNYSGGMNGEIMRLAEYVSADSLLKRKILPDIEKNNEKLLDGCKTSEDFHNAAKKLSLVAAKIGIKPEELKCFQEAEKQEKEAKDREIAAERQARTFKNVLYDTIEEKQAVEQHSNEINRAYRQLEEKINSAKLLNSSPSEDSILNLDGWLDSIIDNGLKGWDAWRYDNEIKRFTDIANDKFFEGGEDGRRLIEKYTAQLEKYKRKAVKTEEQSVWNGIYKGGKWDKKQIYTVADTFLKTDFADKESVNELRSSLKENNPSNLESFNSAIELLSSVSSSDLKLMQNHTLFLSKGFGMKVLLKVPISLGITIAILIVMTILRDIPKIMTMEQYEQASNTILTIWLIGISVYLLINVIYRYFVHSKWKIATVNRSLLHPMLQSPKQYVSPDLVIGTSKDRKAAKSREAMQKQLELQQKQANGKGKK